MAMAKNLLVILPCGLRTDAHGAAGVWPIVTPYLDTLAEGSLALEAVCTAPHDTGGLIGLYSGLHARQHAFSDPTDAVPSLTGWPAALREGGYRLSGVGRVRPIAEHLDEVCLTGDLSDVDDPQCPYLLAAARDGYLEPIAQHRRRRQRTGPLEPRDDGVDHVGHDIDGFIIEQAVGMLSRQPSDQPWAVIAALTGPGNHLPAPKMFCELIDPAPLADGFIPADLTTVETYAELTWPKSLLQNLTPERLAEIRRHYLARVAMVDHAVGRLRDAVDRHAHTRSTWIILCSDHGMLLGERGLVGQRSWLGPAVTGPLWVLPPAGTTGVMRKKTDDRRQATGLVSTVDLSATVAAIAGVDPPRCSNGRSVLPGLYGHDVGAEATISEFDGRLMLETLRYRIVFDNERTDAKCLFDLAGDPDERKNLIDTVEGANLIDMLRWQLAGMLMPLRPVRF